MDFSDLSLALQQPEWLNNHIDNSLFYYFRARDYIENPMDGLSWLKALADLEYLVNNYPDNSIYTTEYAKFKEVMTKLGY
jgi:hypothetical protein